jgi:PcfJ-like protein
MLSWRRTFGVWRQVDLVVHRSPEYLRAMLVGESGSSFLIEFRALPPVRLRVVAVSGLPEYPPHCWPMTRGPQRYTWTRDPFLMATRWAYRSMFPRSACGPTDPNAKQTMRDVYGALAALQREAAERCEPSARAIALRFPPHLRLWLYARLTEDPRRRLAQLSTVCPGALTFAFGLTGAGRLGKKAGARLLADVVAGRRLDRALADAIEAWATDATDRALVASRVDPVWDRVRRVSGVERERLLSLQTLLVRRAGPMVATTTLFLPPPVSFAPEDIPGAVRDNARWFSFVKCSRLLLAPPDEDSARLEGLSAFISKNAPALAGRGRGLIPRTIVGCLRDYAVATNRWPVRTSSGQFLEDAMQWHDRMAAITSLAELAELTPDQPLDPKAPLPHPPVGDWRDGDVDVAPVTSVGGLINEGNEMRHCVAASHGSVARGRTAVYHATIEGKPLTIEIGRHHLGWRIQEAKGFANREPTAAEWSALRRWEAELG